MSQAYRIDRINLISYPHQKKKTLNSLRCRYLAKSQIINCIAQKQRFEFVNFRGAHFKNVRFDSSAFSGCDFWGTYFNNCSFKNVRFEDCIFMACRFKKCEFDNSTFSYTTIVNTGLDDCNNIDISKGIAIYKEYPECELTPELINALDQLKSNDNLRKRKLLFINESTVNHLNIYLLQKRYSDRLPALILLLQSVSTSTITTYKKLERVLNKLSKCDTINMSRPTQSRDCVANET